MRSGYIYLLDTDNTLRNASIAADDWSSRGSDTRYDSVSVPSAYDIAFNTDAVYSSFGPNERWHAFPLRCLSTVLDM